MSVCRQDQFKGKIYPMSMRLAGQPHFLSVWMGRDQPKKKSNLWSHFCLAEVKRDTKVLRGWKNLADIYDSPTRPIILVSGVEMLSKPWTVSYREWEIRRSWLSSRELTWCSKTGGLPGASYKDREKHDECTKSISNIWIMYCAFEIIITTILSKRVLT